jgi:hypothetical protein
MSIKVDGKTYNVSVTSVDLETEFIYKYAERTEDFKLNYELGAVYHNQSLTFGVMDSNNTDFVNLYKLLSTKSTIDDGTGHNVEIWTPMGKMSFLMYPNSLQVSLKKERGNKTWWSGFTVKFIAVEPVESW